MFVKMVCNILYDITLFPWIITWSLIQGVKLIFFSDSHLAPKFFKVVANSKKLVAIFKDKQNISLRCQRSR